MAATSGKLLIVVCGPTAVGKTAFAIDLAKRYGTEILSADSRQLFREIPIGTAQPTQAEMQGVVHHFVADRSVVDPFNAGKFESEGLARLEKLFKANDVAVICGGTGLYIDALCTGLDALPLADADLRAELELELKTVGIASLQNRLKELDPEHFAAMDINNPGRLIRALEVCIKSGKKYSDLRQRAVVERPFEVRYIGLDLPRPELYARIELRVDAMLRAGWLDEVKSVVPHRAENALRTVGYKELFAHLDGELSLDEATYLIKQNTRRFAKRQLTWFRRNQQVLWQRPEAH